MGRRGVEAKPTWQAIPRPVRDAVEAALGSRVRRAARVWGGYSATPTFRLQLADGRRVFFKGTGPDDTAFARAAFKREERVYRQLTDRIAPWAPELYGTFRDDPWAVLLLEDLGAKSTPPWPPGVTRRIARAYGEFHRSTLGAVLPAWLPQPDRYLSRFTQVWEKIAQKGELPRVAALASERADEALRWLEAAQPILSRTSLHLLQVGPPHALLHGDTRSDNLRWLDGRLRLFDWPHVGIGPAEFDLAAFAESITVEGGPEPEQFVAWYAERAPVREEALDSAVAEIAGFFADGAWLPDIPSLPRLRPFQRAQLRVTLAWAARRLRLPAPDWLDAVVI